MTAPMYRLAVRRALLALVALFAALAAPASAHEYPDQRDADTIVEFVVEKAVSWWESDTRDDRLRRGITDEQLARHSCPHRLPTVWQAPDLDGAWGRGDGRTCEMWVSDSLAAKLDEAIRWQTMAKACTAVVHEVGHARGLPHTRTGVMAGDGAHPPRALAWTPTFCIRWARAEFAGILRGEGWTERQIRRALGRPPKLRS